MTELIDIKSIVIDPTVYVRNSLNLHTVWTYETAMKSQGGDEFPPIHIGIYKNQFYLIDGMHRLEARKRLKQLQIEATLQEYKTKKQMFLEFVSRNIKGKLPFTEKDLRLIIDRLRRYRCSKKQAYKLLYMTPTRFDRLRNMVIVKEDGEIVPIGSIQIKQLADARTTLKAIEKTMEFETDKIYVSNNAEHVIVQFIQALKDHMFAWENEKILSYGYEALQLLRDQLPLEVIVS